MAKKYKVIGVKRIETKDEIEIVDGKKTVKEVQTEVYDPVEMVSQAGMAKGRAFNWDPGSEVTEKQVSDEQAKELIAAGQIELLEETE